MKPIIEEKDGIQIAIHAVTKNKEYSCNHCPQYTSEHCSLKRKLSIDPNAKNLTATEIIVSVANISDRQINVPARCWELVDSDGFSFGCNALCEDHILPRMINPDSWTITPGTQVKFALAFPEMEEKVNAVSLICTTRPMFRMNIRKPTKKIEALLAAKEAYENNKLSKSCTTSINE